MSQPPDMIPDLRAHSDQLSTPALEAKMHLASNWTIKGIRIAPGRSPTAPCFLVLAVWFHLFRLHLAEISTRRSISSFALLRLEYGKLLDACVHFANSTWTPEQKATFEGCHCPYHETRDAQLFNDFVFKELQWYCRGFGALHDIVTGVFSLITGVVDDMMSNQADVIRLERRNRKKRGKWPSSPSQFIPHSASSTLSALIKWSRLTEHPAPLFSLNKLTLCCPSLEHEMKQNEDLLPLIASLFSQFLNGIKRPMPDEEAAKPVVGHDILGFYEIFTGNWFRDQLLVRQSKEATITSLLSIYSTLGDIMPLLGDYITPANPFKLEGYQEQFGIVGSWIYDFYIASNHIPLHHSFIPYYDPPASNIDSYEVMMLAVDAISLRNQLQCTHIPCTQTTESTKANLKMCSGCHVVRYCSKPCQAGDWKEHKPVCKLLKEVLPVATVCEAKAPSESVEESSCRFLSGLKERGLTDGDISSVRMYAHLRVRLPAGVPFQLLKGTGALVQAFFGSAPP